MNSVALLRNINRLRADHIVRCSAGAVIPRRRRLDRSTASTGLTLVELVTSLLVLAAMLAVAVPTFRGFHGDSDETWVRANIRAAVPIIELYFNDNGTYVGITEPALRDIDPQIAPTLDYQNLSRTSYCVDDESAAGLAFRKIGPAGAIEPGRCPQHQTPRRPG